MLVVVILGAVQMFVLGMIGEYLGRVYVEAKKRPLYIVAEIAGHAGGKPSSAMSPSRRRSGRCSASGTDTIAASETPGVIGSAADRVPLQPENLPEQKVDRLRRQGVVAALLAEQPPDQPRARRGAGRAGC